MRIRTSRRTKLIALFLSLSLITLVSAEILSRQLVWQLQSTEPEYSITFGTTPPDTIMVGRSINFSLVFTNVASSPELRRGTLLIHVECQNPETLSIETAPTIGAGGDSRYDAGIWFFDVNGNLSLPWWILPNLAVTEVNYILYINEVDLYSFRFIMDDVIIV